jgi:hypothetical protein
MAVLLKILDLLLLVVPMISNWWKEKKDEMHSAANAVRKQQDQKLKFTEAVLDRDSQELTKIAKGKLLITRELLKRVRNKEG